MSVKTIGYIGLKNKNYLRFRVYRTHRLCMSQDFYKVSI